MTSRVSARSTSGRPLGSMLCMRLPGNDGVYFTPRLDGDRQCMLVIIGADEYGEKDVLAIMDGLPCLRGK